MVKVIIVAHVAVISHLDYNLHLGNHWIVGVCENTVQYGANTVSLTRLQIKFPWYIVTSVAITMLESRRKSKSPVSQSKTIHH